LNITNRQAAVIGWTRWELLRQLCRAVESSLSLAWTVSGLVLPYHAQ